MTTVVRIGSLYGSGTRYNKLVNDTGDTGILTPCDLVVWNSALNGITGFDLYRDSSYADAPAGLSITLYHNTIPIAVIDSSLINSLPKNGSYTSLVTASGSGSEFFTKRNTVDCPPLASCSDDSDCDTGEKCVDGECVPCDEQQATHFQIRAEFEELVTLPDGSQTMYLLSGVYPIGSGVSNQIIQLAECNGVWYYPRIRFCDASGAIKPYTGALSFYGYCNPDGSAAMWVNNFSVTNQSHLLGQRAQMDLHFASPLSIPRILIEFIDSSSVIYESDCSSVTPEEPPDIEPVPPTEPDEPDEPEEPLPPDDIEEPLPPSAPLPPQEGLCPCEEYIGRQIGRAADILYSGLIALKRELSQGFREIVVELWEKRKLDYQLSMFFQNQQFQIMQAHHQRLFEIRQVLESVRDDVHLMRVELESIHDEVESIDDTLDKGLILPECGSEPEKGLVEVFDDFSQKYEPVDVVVEESDIWQHSPDEAPRNYPRKL